MKSLALLCLLIATAAPARAEPPRRRLALVVGVNDGGAPRPRLRYATSDARAFARVLEDLGGVAIGDMLLLEEPDAARLREGLAELARRAAALTAAGTRVEAIVYFSGHSNAEALLPRGEPVGYIELRKSLEGIAAEVRVAVIDACASGAFTRLKGGKPYPPFLLDSALELQGHAFLTAASADEAAQESDSLGGSFFTTALIAGLRGAADYTGRGRVTLVEAYQFAFDDTVARTEKTSTGAQHPTFDIQLSGRGDVVMTDLHNLDAGLSVPADFASRLSVRDSDGRLVIELRKTPHHRVDLRLDTGRYLVLVDQDAKMLSSQVELVKGKLTDLALSHFEPASLEVTRLRGDGTAARPPQMVLVNYADMEKAMGDDPMSLQAVKSLRTRGARSIGIGVVGGLVGIGLGVAGFAQAGQDIVPSCTPYPCYEQHGPNGALVALGLGIGLSAAVWAVIVAPKTAEIIGLFNEHNGRHADAALVPVFEPVQNSAPQDFSPPSIPQPMFGE